jgi:GH24 family phage-related lysozyme (muramidase)
MKSYNLISIFFCGAMVYQLSSIAYNTNDKTKLTEISNDSITKPLIVENINIKTPVKQSLTHSKKPKYTKPESYKISKVGKDFIKKHETCVLKAYNDPDPKRRSVGWGHQIRPGENLEHITKAKADELFEEDVQWVNDAINRLIAQNDNRFIYSQGFIDGLGSLIYNCGERGVTLTKFYERWQKCRYDKNSENYINMNDFKFAIAAVKTSRISAPGHVQRRYNEHKLMLN